MKLRLMISTTLISLFLASAAQATSLNVICYKAKASIDGAQFTAGPVTGQIENSCTNLEGSESQLVSFSLFTEELDGVEQPFAQLALEVNSADLSIAQAEVNHSNGKNLEPMIFESGALKKITEGLFTLKQKWTWESPNKNTFIFGKTLELECELEFVNSCQ